MSLAASLAAAFFALWIDYGWQPLEGGGHEYIVQVPPELIDTLRTEGLKSYVPPEVSDIRRIRITVGSEPLPREASSLASQKQQETDSRLDRTTARPATEPPDMPAGGENRRDPSANAAPRTAKYAADESEAMGLESETRPAQGDSADWLSSLGADSTTIMQLGLAVAAAAIVFLLWVHISTRRRYRQLLRQLPR